VTGSGLLSTISGFADGVLISFVEEAISPSLSNSCRRDRNSEIFTDTGAPSCDSHFEMIHFSASSQVLGCLSFATASRMNCVELDAMDAVLGVEAFLGFFVDEALVPKSFIYDV